MIWNFPRGHFWPFSSRRWNKWVQFFSYLVLAMGIISLFRGHDVRSVTEDQIIRQYPNKHFKRKDVKKILIWEPFLGTNIAELESECLKHCVPKCEITLDKTDVISADAINFHLSDLWDKFWSIGTRSIVNLPTYRRPDQVWIISNMEPPQHLWGDLEVLNGLFNWTQWYRTDADIQWLYGQPYKLSKREQKQEIRKMSKRNIFKEKSKEVCGRISNCMDSNRRYTTINKMKTYLDIEMFGLCYNNPCGDTRHQLDRSCESIVKEYKFYLAFENNDCKDYVTEKYWQSLERDQIPIVNWKLLNRSLVVPHSYINIYDFKDIESASRYIKKVSKSETLYNSYFQWKTSYKNQHRCPSCQICEAQFMMKTRKLKLLNI